MKTKIVLLQNCYKRGNLFYCYCLLVPSTGTQTSQSNIQRTRWISTWNSDSMCVCVCQIKFSACAYKNEIRSLGIEFELKGEGMAIVSSQLSLGDGGMEGGEGHWQASKVVQGSERNTFVIQIYFFQRCAGLKERAFVEFPHELETLVECKSFEIGLFARKSSDSLKPRVRFSDETNMKF